MNLHCKIMSKSNISKLNISKLNISKLNISKLDIHKIFYSIFWRAAAQGVEGARVDLFSKTQSQFFPLNFNSQIPVHFLAMFITWILWKHMIWCSNQFANAFWSASIGKLNHNTFLSNLIFSGSCGTQITYSVFSSKGLTTSVMYNKSFIAQNLHPKNQPTIMESIKWILILTTLLPPSGDPSSFGKKYTLKKWASYLLETHPVLEKYTL